MQSNKRFPGHKTKDEKQRACYEALTQDKLGDIDNYVQEASQAMTCKERILNMQVNTANPIQADPLQRPLVHQHLGLHSQDLLGDRTTSSILLHCACNVLLPSP